jgi:hypothetical protein
MLINIDRVIVNRVRLYTNCSTVQGQTIIDNCCTHEHDDDWHIFDVETDFARFAKFLSVTERLVI